MRNYFMRTSAFTLVCLVLLMTCCTRSCSNKAEQNHIITVAVGTPLEALDPRYTTTAAATRIANLIYAPLFELGDDLFPKPFLAVSFENIDNEAYKITLRRNLKFHDGTPITAHDVVYTYQGLKSKEVASPYAAKFNYLSSIKALDDFTILFKFNKPYAPFLTDLCPIGIVSRKSCEGRSKLCRHELNGSGPYKLKSWDMAKEAVHLVPHPDWFEGPPKNGLLFRVVRDENTRVLELVGKKTDIIDSDLSPHNALRLKSYPHLLVQELPGLGYTYLAFNVRGPRPEDQKESSLYRTRLALSDKRVRKAIAHSIDFGQIIEKVFLNTATRSSGLIPNGHWAKDSTLKPPAFDPKMAEIELDKAGFKRLGPDHMRFKLTISTTPNRLRQGTAQLFADFLKRVGIDVTVRVKDFSALYQDMKQGQFEMFSHVWVPVTEPDLYHFVHHSSSIPSEENAGGNRHGFTNIVVDRLIDEGQKTFDVEKRKVIYQAIEQKMLEELPYIPLWNEDRIVVLNKDKVKGFIPSPTGSLLSLRKAYVDMEKRKAGN